MVPSVLRVVMVTSRSAWTSRRAGGRECRRGGKRGGCSVGGRAGACPLRTPRGLVRQFGGALPPIPVVVWGLGCKAGPARTLPGCTRCSGDALLVSRGPG